MNFDKTKTYKSFKKSKYLSIKHKNYFYIYDKLLEKYRNKNITFVEIGIFSGGSLFMWKNFFGKKARIIGIDLNPEAKKFEKDGFEIIDELENLNEPHTVIVKGFTGWFLKIPTRSSDLEKIEPNNFFFVGDYESLEIVEIV